MHRRDVLGGAAAAGVAALAGCTSALGAVAAPDVPEEALDDGGWVKQDESQETVLEETYGPVSLEGRAHTLTYEDEALAASIREKTLGELEGAFALFSATRIDFSPNLDSLPVSGGIVLDEVEANARQTFRERMGDAGLADVTRTDTGELAVDTGETARLTQYEAAFPFEGITYPVGDAELEIEGEPLAVSGLLAVWRHADSVLVAGGASPAENFATTVERDLSEAIHVSVDVDLGLTPDAYHEELRGLVTGVE